MSQGNGTTRRTLLKGAGAAGVGATALGGTALFSGTAAAEMGLNANDATVGSPDGSVDEVFIRPSGSIEWEDFTDQVDAISVEIQSRARSVDGESTFDGWTTKYDETHGVTEDHHGSFSGQNLGKITLYDGDDTETFEADSDGSVQDRWVDLQVDVKLMSDGELAEPTDEAEMSDSVGFTATSQNRPGEADFGGDIDTGMDPGAE